ncbi:putative bifunctional diguanylate cyclase/phosphodiesterase [Azohydromonas aeria]|uniref:putative bifunctional diguanylate cyclase/phosphodiesterase n=1 Tax=Azohydromonas aeria TaxID=2590212 RepID=UPI0012FA0CEC|nr:EAL domain-containing protein [Azohydromonas aeria]
MRASLVLFLAVSLAVLAGLGWDAHAEYAGARSRLPVIARMHMLRTDILQLDEVLTMSARMAAATGDLAWERRYREVEPRLDAAIKEALALAPDAARGSAAAATDAANTALVTMENQAFELVRQGRAERAQQLLAGDEYTHQKRIYGAGMVEFNQHLLDASEALGRQMLSSARRSVGITLASALGLLLGVLFVLRSTRRWQHAVMRSHEALNARSAELAELNVRLDTRVRERTQALWVSAQQARLAAERAEFLAYNDALTGLPNRAMFSRLLGQALDAGPAPQGTLALLFVDLDRFKNVNDTLGHEAGDRLLRDMALRLRGCVGAGDTVARLGGDEFVVLATGADGAAALAALAQRLLAAVSRPLALAGQEFHVTASVGISMYPRDGEDERTLMKHADIAMYQAKEDGKNTYAFYSADANAHSLERLAFESSLRRALAAGQFEVHYQPKVDAHSGALSGVEALLRWKHPDLGLVSPARFIPVAEEMGLIVDIGRWVLETACAQHVAWRAQGLAPLRVAVNLSARQFYDDALLGDVRAVLERTGMDPAWLELEITESMLMRHVDEAVTVLQAFKALGIRVSLDDFGTGYSSLANLKRFPIDTIKIDRSFVHDLPASEEDRAITEAVIAMGRTLSMTVVAEGVETQDHIDFLKARGCDELQGWFFGKAVPAADIAGRLQRSP